VISAILFDIGGVLVELDGVPTLAKLMALENASADAIHERWMQSHAVIAYESGRISASAFAAAAVSELQLAVTAEWFLDAFNAWPKGLHPGALELLDEIPKRFRVAALSNTSASHWERIEAMGLAARFEQLYLSHQIGCLKPSRDAFAAALDGLAVPASEVLFLDDISSNVTAARALGLHAEVVSDPREARVALQRYDILP
jgi:putative hydrolase of the HAD superfamily